MRRGVTNNFAGDGTTPLYQKQLPIELVDHVHPINKNPPSLVLIPNLRVHLARSLDVPKSKVVTGDLARTQHEDHNNDQQGKPNNAPHDIV